MSDIGSVISPDHKNVVYVIDFGDVTVDALKKLNTILLFEYYFLKNMFHI